MLTSLPRSRPVRRSAKRAARPDPATADVMAKPAAKARKPAAKPKIAVAAAAATAKPKAAARPPRRPRAVVDDGPRQAPPRKIPPAGYASPTSNATAGDQSAAADLIGTALQAAGELAQIGVALGRQTLRSMIDRLPKP